MGTPIPLHSNKEDNEMEERKVKGKPVIYIRVGETFTTADGQKYKAVQDEITHRACDQCDFIPGGGLCGRYRCVAGDRADDIGVHFVKVEG